LAAASLNSPQDESAVADMTGFEYNILLLELRKLTPKIFLRL